MPVQHGAETKALKDQLRLQNREIARLKGRIGDIVDELGSVKNDLSSFKEKLSEDLTKIVEKIVENS